MRYKTSKDYTNDCLTICDEEEELQTSFGSEIVLYPLEDAETVVDKLNFYELLVKELMMHLEYQQFNEVDRTDVIITKSSGDPLILFMRDQEVLDWIKVEK